MAGLRKEKIILLILAVTTAVMVGYNVFSVESQKLEVRMQIEEGARIEKKMLEELKSRETVELAEYYEDYKLIKAEFVGKAAELSAEARGEIVNFTKLKEITTERLEAAKDYREKLNGIDTPKPLKTFLACELEFIESDIKTLNLMLSYYGSESYSNFKNSAIEKLYENTRSLLLKAEEELRRVYEQYNLGSMLHYFYSYY